MTDVTIGMPVLNGELSVRNAIRDLQSQTYKDFKLIVCDNASDDNTVAVVEQLAQNDSRIELRKFEERVDVLLNFERAFDAAETEYFMFAAADDRWYPEFIENNLKVLKQFPDVVASTGRVAFTSNGKFSHISTGTRPYLNSAHENFLDYLIGPNENARIFSLFRQEALVDAFPKKFYPGWDFQLIARVVCKGKFHELHEVLCERELTPAENYIIQAEKYFGSVIASIIPLRTYIFAILKDKNFAGIKGKKRTLLKLAYKSHMNYAKHRLPRWHGLLERFQNFFELDEFEQFQSK